MQYYRFILIVVLCCLGKFILAQSTGNGSIIIIQDASIDTLLDKHVEMNEKLLLLADNYAIDGYRIQIFEESGNKSSTRARVVMSAFAEEYPDIPSYLTWQAPNFKVRVGDFQTRMDAEGFLNKIKKDYPIAWVIKDKIKYPIIN
jgi:hypothetical protein